jgi:hypothetical protein
MATAKEILDAARNLLETHWCKGTYARKDVFGNVVACCARGALEIAAEDCGALYTTPFFDATDAIYEFVKPFGSIESWNDAPMTTKEIVLKVFERVANQ